MIKQKETTFPRGGLATFLGHGMSWMGKPSGAIGHKAIIIKARKLILGGGSPKFIERARGDRGKGLPPCPRPVLPPQQPSDFLCMLII